MSQQGQGSPPAISTRIAAHLRHNVVGYLALVIALSGTAWAANQVTSRQIARNAVRSKHIKDGQVRSADVADNALTGTDIDESSLQIAQQAADIADGSITTGKLADDAVTGAKVDESSLDSSVLQRRVDQACGANQTISAISATGAVSCHTDADSAPGPNSITSAEIADSTIANADISPSAGISSSKLAGQLGVFTGQVAHLPAPAFSFLDASASGITDETTFPTASALATLTPATTLTASGLAVRLDAPPGLGKAWTVSLIVDGNVALTCSVADPGQTCDSGPATYDIPPGSSVWLSLFSQGPGSLASTRALFGWQVR